MKYLKRILLILIPIFLILFISIFHITTKNKKYESKLKEEIKINYQLEEEIETINKYNKNYIIITKTKVVVLNKKYQLLLEENIKKLAKNKDNYTLIYKNNKLLYENTILKKDKVIYEYYDAYTYEYLDKIIMEG